MKHTKTLLIVFLSCFATYSLLFDDTTQGISTESNFGIYQSLPEKAERTILINQTLSKDINALKTLTYLSCGGGAGCYDHGWVLVQILYRLGDVQFAEMIKSWRPDEKTMLLSFLYVGAEYGMTKDHYYIDKHYPKTTQALRTKPQQPSKNVEGIANKLPPNTQ